MQGFQQNVKCWSSSNSARLCFRPTLFLQCINELDGVICNVTIYADDTTALYSNCDQVSGLFQQLELVSELESDLRDTIWGRNWLFDFNTGKTQLVSFDLRNNSASIDVNGSVLEEKSSFKMWRFSRSLLNLIRALPFSLLLKLPPRKFDCEFFLPSFLLLRLLSISVNLPYGLCMEYCCNVWAGVASSCWIY